MQSYLSLLVTMPKLLKLLMQQGQTKIPPKSLSTKFMKYKFSEAFIKSFVKIKDYFATIAIIMKEHAKKT